MAALFYMLGGGVCCFVAWWLWPTGITDLTIAAITLGMILKAAGSFSLWCTGIAWSLGGLVAAFEA